MITRRTLFEATILCILAIPCGAAVADAYPTRPVRIIVPFPAGGPSDILARLLAQRLSDKMRQTVYVENIAGAGGNIGTGAAARANADGYTLLLAGSHFWINPSLSAKIPYDPIASFEPVMQVAASPHIIAVHPALPANNATEFVALLRASPGKYAFASPGNGTTGHLAGERFRLTLNLDLTHVPFNGAAPAVSSTIGGHTQIVFVPLSTAVGAVEDGKLRAIAIPSNKRAAVLPEVPTLLELGIRDQQADLFQGVLTPALTPRSVIETLNRHLADIVMQPDTSARLEAVGFVPTSGSPETWNALIKSELVTWGHVIRGAKIGTIY